MSYTTSNTLLNGVCNHDDESWKQFEKFYAPLMEICGKDYHLSPLEIEELRQEVLLAVFKEGVVENYEKERGRFRNYLRAVIHRKAYALIKNRRIILPIDTIDDIPEEPEKWSKWDEEWQAFIFDVALKTIKEEVSVEQYMAFDMYALKNIPPKQVAKAMGISVDSVYQNKTRMTQRLSEIVEILKKEP